MSFTSSTAQFNLPVWGRHFQLTNKEVKFIIQGFIALVFGAFIYFQSLKWFKPSKFPLINPAKGFDFTNWQGRKAFPHRSAELLKQGQAQYKDKVFRVMTDIGPVTIIPSCLINAIRNEENLNFMQAVADDFHAQLPGFEFTTVLTSSNALLQKVALNQLTRFLGRATKPLSEETESAVERCLGKTVEWKSIVLYPELLDIVTRASCRVFLGPTMCRHNEWLDISKNYTVAVFLAAVSLRKYPKWMRNYIHWFVPQCKALRAMGARAKIILAPLINERKQARANGLSKGKPAPAFDDSLDWIEDESNGAPYDPALAQLALSTVAIHTSTDLVTETLLRLARRPSLVDELRQEIISVLRAGGWKKTSLFKMALLDSVIKESQRLRPLTLGPLTRKATGDVYLPTGDVIPKGSRTVCLSDQHWDPAVYPEPNTFDPYRFKRRRGTEMDSTAHLVSTAPDSLGFGHGKHACPGRFFAADELKIVLCHLLMKYDWKVDDNAPLEPEPILHSFDILVDQTAQVYVKRREAIEFDIDAI